MSILFRKEFTNKSEKEAVEIFKRECLNKFDINVLKKASISIKKDVADPLCTIDKAWVIELIGE